MIKDFLVLIKIRITILVMITSYLGYYLGLRSLKNPEYMMVEASSIILFLHLLVGIFFTSSSSAILNQYFEIKLDAKMLRTKSRPLPNNRIDKNLALLVGIIFAIIGIFYLFIYVNPLTSFISFLTVFSYVFR